MKTAAHAIGIAALALSTFAFVINPAARFVTETLPALTIKGN